MVRVVCSEVLGVGIPMPKLGKTGKISVAAGLFANFTYGIRGYLCLE